jgi:hypothetical protein
MQGIGSLLVRTDLQRPLGHDRYRTLPQDVVALNGYTGRRLSRPRPVSPVGQGHVEGYDDAKYKKASGCITLNYSRGRYLCRTGAAS